MSYLEVTKESYEATAEEFAENVKDLAPVESIKKLIALLPPKACIIDIGCGSGRDAKIFTENEINVLGVDICNNLIEIAKKNAPLGQFQVRDIETCVFPDSHFDGAWSGCTLSHVPKKTIPNVLKSIHSSLKKNGYFYLTVRKGSGEGLQQDDRYGNIEKYWTYFEQDEIENFLKAAGFKIIESCAVQNQFKYPTHPCIRIFCQKQ